MESPRIAIVGAGPVGCMLGRLLHLANIPCTIFESEASPNYRSQGGTLDLHTDTGLAALKEAGLFDKFLELARYDGESLLITDRNLAIQMRQGSSGGNGKTPLGGRRPEIDRSQLRRLLTESLPKDMIRWGHHLRSVEEDGRLVFEHTTESGFDLIVGADGAWSKVRKALTDQKPFFSGLSMYDFSIPDPQTRLPELYKTVNRGSLFAFAEGREVTMQQMGDGTFSSYAIFRTEEDWLENWMRHPLDLAQVKDTLLNEERGSFRDYHPLLRDGLAHAEGKFNARALYMLPVGFSWKHRRGFTIIGDAAHVMTPFAGEGVNVGLDDARRLAAAIVAATANKRGQGTALDRVDRAVEKFEKEMVPRVQRFTELTEGAMKAYFFTPGSPQSTIANVMSMHVRFHTPWILHPFATAAVHVFHFFTRLFG